MNVQLLLQCLITGFSIAVTTVVLISIYTVALLYVHVMIDGQCTQEDIDAATKAGLQLLVRGSVLVGLCIAATIYIWMY